MQEAQLDESAFLGPQRLDESMLQDQQQPVIHVKGSNQQLKDMHKHETRCFKPIRYRSKQYRDEMSWHRNRRHHRGRGGSNRAIAERFNQQEQQSKKFIKYMEKKESQPINRQKQPEKAFNDYRQNHSPVQSNKEDIAMQFGFTEHKRSSNHEPATFGQDQAQSVPVFEIDLCLQPEKPSLKVKKQMVKHSFNQSIPTVTELSSQQLQSSLLSEEKPLNVRATEEEVRKYSWTRVHAVIVWTGQFLKVKVSEVVYQPLDLPIRPQNKPSWLMWGEWDSIHVRRQYQSHQQTGNIDLGRIRVPPAYMTHSNATPFLRVSSLRIKCFCKWKGELRLGQDMTASFSCEQCSAQQTIGVITLPMPVKQQ